MSSDDEWDEESPAGMMEKLKAHRFSVKARDKMANAVLKMQMFPMSRG
jgi:hypothetical protein